MKICSKCGALMAEKMNFCTQCGNSLANAATTSSQNESIIKQPPPFPPVQGGIEAKPKRKFSLTNLFRSKKPTSPTSPKKPFSVGKLLKRICIAVVVIAIGFGLWVNHQLNAATYLTFNTEGVLFPKCGAEEEVNIDYDGFVWELAYKPSWVEIDEYDNSFAIKCEPNSTGQDRQDHITIKSGKITQALPIGQYGAAQSISLSKSSIKCSRGWETFSVSMQTDGISPKVASCPDFCYVSNLTKDGFVVGFRPNEDYSRSGTIVIQEDDAQASISVRQKGKCSNCGGDGTVTCGSCWGNGSMGWGMFYSQCNVCLGRGSWSCSICDGTGYEK